MKTKRRKSKINIINIIVLSILTSNIMVYLEPYLSKFSFHKDNFLSHKMLKQE